MDKDYEKNYVALEKKHPWFVARRTLCYNLVRSKNKEIRILDFGCGSGIFLNFLKKRGFANVVGFEPSTTILPADGSLRIYRNKEKIKDSFDIIFLLDVIEHIQKPRESLEFIHNHLNDDGLLIASAPAYHFLKSYHDVVNMHYRRYNKHSFLNEFEGVNFFCQRIFFWNAILFIPLAGVILLNRLIKRKLALGMPSPFALRAYLLIYCIENYCIMQGINLPFGVSLFGIFKKKLSTATINQQFGK